MIVVCGLLKSNKKIDIFKKQLSLISFYSPFYRSVILKKESSNDHVVSSCISQMFRKISALKNFGQQLPENPCDRVPFLIKLQALEIYKETPVLESCFQ